MCVCLSLRSFMYDGTVFSLNISGFILCVIYKHYLFFFECTWERQGLELSPHSSVSPFN